LAPETAIEEVKTKRSTRWRIDSLIRLTLPIGLFV